MKKILVSLCLLLPLNINAQKVSEIEAMLVARNFYLETYKSVQNKNLSGFKFKNELKTVDTSKFKSLYIFNTENNSGFVIISGNKAVYPILGYSFEGSFEKKEMPPVVEEWIGAYSLQIENQNMLKSSASNKTKTTWEKYTDANFKSKFLSPGYKSLKNAIVMDVPPLLSTTWNQGNYYNTLCPTCPSGGSGGHVWAGCVATAQAQLMKYYNYPEHGVGEHSYNHSVYGLQSANFENTTYNWSNMPSSLSSHNNDVATLLYHCGVSVNMNYSPSGSGASGGASRTSLVNYFKYSSNALFTSKGNYTEENWKNLLKKEIDAGRPMYYVGYGSGGHAFNCDGYQGVDYFHFNWGWGGAYNGYFYINDLTPGGHNYTNSQAALVGAVPGPMETKLDSANAIILSCGVSYNGTTVDGENIVNQYLGSYWHNTGKEKIHKITTTYDGRISAKISNLNGNNLDIFILKYADRKYMLANGDSVATADNTEAGTYYVIVDGRYGCEGTYTLEVNCPDSQADLIVEKGKVKPMSITAGGKMNVVSTIKNIGNSIADTSTLKYYVSNDQVHSGDDIYLGSTVVGLLNPHDEMLITNLLDLPANTESGTKYIILKVDANNMVPETDEELNTTVAYFQIPDAGIMDCSNAIALENGVKYEGNNNLYGQAIISNYSWFNGLDNKEVIHSFTPEYSGFVNLEFVESLPGEMNLILLAGCNENACINSFSLYHSEKDTLREGFYVVGGINYYLVVDGTNQTGNCEGYYSIKTDMPGECPSPHVSSSSTDKCIGDGNAFLYTDWEYSSFQWRKNGEILAGENSNSISVSENGLYSVEVVENGCTGESDGIQVTYSSKPSSASISAISDTVFCEGSSVVLQLSTGIGYSHQWTRDNEAIPTATELNFEVFESGEYRALVTNESCTIESNPVEVVVKHSAIENGQALQISTDSLITHWPFDKWGTDASGYGNYAGINGAFQCVGKDNEYTAFHFDGLDDYIYSSKQFENPDTFTVAIWFKTSSNGPLIGFDDQRFSAASINFGRSIYLDTSGLVCFGTDNGAKHTISSSKSYNDEEWHLAVASLSPDGMKLYIDGKPEAQIDSITNGKVFTGYWKVATGDLTDWPNMGNQFFSGVIDDIRIYKRALNDDEIEVLYEKQILKITAEENVICSLSGSTIIWIENSEPGINYRLMNALTNTQIGPGVQGTSGTISLPTGMLSSTTQLQIVAENTITACINELDSVYNIAIATVVPEVNITSNASFEEFCKGDTVRFNQASLYGGSSPNYTWKVNGQKLNNHNEMFFSSDLEDNDIVSLEMISSVECANPKTVSSNEILVNINLPVVNLGADTSIQTNETVVLDAGEGYQVYNWNTDETSQKITVEGSIGEGEYIYSVLVTDSNNCSNSDTIVVEIKTLLSSHYQDYILNFKAYPNPVHDILFIELQKNVSSYPLELELINNAGQRVLHKVYHVGKEHIKEELYLGDLKKGMYILCIKSNESGKKTFKLVVE